jgi:hypothetical protein
MDVPGFEAERFRSKRDGWLMALLNGVVVLELATPIWIGLAEPGPVPWVVMLVCLPTAALLVSILRTTDYAIDAGAGMLRVRCGPFRWGYRLDRIAEVRPSRSPASGPALSLDRLAVRGKFSTLLISPEDREGFLERLAAAAPGLERRGDRLVRRESAAAEDLGAPR